MRPVQNHRILKEVFAVDSASNQGAKLPHQQLVPLLQPNALGHGFQKLQPFTSQSHKGMHQANHHLPRLESGELLTLQQRVKELEKDNFKLQHHVQQAEQSIRNYRDILAAHNLPTTLPSPVMATNAGKVPAAITHESKENKVNLIKAPPPVDMTVVNARHEQQLSALRTQHDLATQELEKSLATMRNENEAHVSRLAAAERKMREMEQAHRQMQLQWEERLQTQTEEIAKQAAEQARWNTLRESLEQQLQQQLLEKQQQKRLSPKKSPGKSFGKPVLGDLTISAWRAVHKEVHDLRDRCRSLQTQLTEEIKKVEHHCLQNIQLILRKSQENQQRHALLLQRTHIDHDTTIIAYMQQIEELQTNMHSLHQQLQAAQEKDRERSRNLISKQQAAEASQATEEAYVLLQLQFQQLQRKQETDRAQTQQHVLLWQKASKEEVSAVKKLAHVKELQRIAKEREYSLDRDRLSLELKHLK